MKILNNTIMKKRTFILAITVLALSSCARSCASFEKKHQVGKRKYQVTMYSGGDTVFQDNVTTIINSESNSDGIYYSKGDTLIELSGDYVLKSID